jgi:hypothetical protein
MGYHETNFKILQNKLMIDMINHSMKQPNIKQVGGQREITATPVPTIAPNPVQSAAPVIASTPATPSINTLLKPIIVKMTVLMKIFEDKLITIVNDYAKKSLSKTENAYNKIIKKFFKLLWGIITGTIGAIPIYGNIATALIKGVKSIDRILMVIKIGVVYFFSMVDTADDKLLVLTKELNQKYEEFLKLKQKIEEVSGIVNEKKDDMSDIETTIQNMFETGLEKTISQVGGQRTPAKPAPAKPAPAKPAPAKPAPAKPAPAKPAPAKPAEQWKTLPIKEPPMLESEDEDKDEDNDEDKDEDDDIDIYNLIPVKKIFKQMITTVTDEIGKDVAGDVFHFSESIVSETIDGFLSLFSEFLVSTFTDMMETIDPTEIQKALEKIEDKQKNFGELKENLERLDVPALFVLPLTARLTILSISKIVYETADDVYGSAEEIISYVESTMKEIINMVVRMIMQGICTTSGDCKIIYS